MLIHPNTWVARFGVCLCLLGGQASLDSQTLAAEEETKARAITIEDVFARYDVNQNGLLEGSECVCEGSKQYDVNQDGKVSQDEFSKGVAQHAGSHEAALKMITQLGGIEKFYALAKSGRLEKIMDVSLDKVFSQWDRNKSGILEADECVCQGSKSADANKDGKVSKEELVELAKSHYGSIDEFVATVRQHGGVEAFYNEVATEAWTIGAVFARYDKNKNGLLESSEWVCENSKTADFNKDGKVTQQEMVVMATRAFGSLERFEQYVKSQGGAAKFYARRNRR